jgi:transglutaminase-like putative cysteine protease
MNGRPTLFDEQRPAPAEPMPRSGRTSGSAIAAAADGSASTPAQLRRAEAVRDLLTQVTLTLAVTVSLVSLLRVVTGTTLRPVVFASIAVGLILPTVLRILGAHWVPALAASIGVETIVVLRWLAGQRAAFVASDPSSGLPGTTSAAVSGDGPIGSLATLVRFGAGQLDEAFSRVEQLVTPAPPLIGFGLVLAVVAWLVASLADTFAAVFRAPLEALVPPAAAAAVAATLLARPKTTGRVGWTLLVLGAYALHALAVTLTERRSLANWFSGRRPGWTGALGAVLIGAALTFGVAGIAAPRLGLHEKPATLDWRTPRAATRAPRVITSPLVSLERRILRQSDVEQFRVRSVGPDDRPVRTYWRQTALDQFDGVTWGSTGTYRAVREGRSLSDDGPESERVRQEFVIGALDTESLPAAYRVFSFATDDPAFTASFDPRSATLLTRDPLQPGTQYRAESALRRTGFTDVAASSAAVPLAPPDDPLLALPDTLDPRVPALAAEVTANATTVLEQARALQSFFRESFRYSVDIDDSGRGGDPLARFLFEDRVGFCQQFSGAFATMARTLGIPSRVAVGFTGGRLGADGWFSVTGKNAHAWPEIRLPDGTWVPFEPTPGRGIPGLSDTTGVPFEDASEGIAPGTDESIVTDPSNPSDPSNAAATSIVPTTTAAPTATAPRVTTEPAPIEPERGATRDRRLLVALALACAGATAGGLLVWRRRRGAVQGGPAGRGARRSGGPLTPAGRVDALWSSLERRLARSTVVARPVRGPEETERHFAARLRAELPMLEPLADQVQRARYDVDGAVGEDELAAATELHDAALAVLSSR